MTIRRLELKKVMRQPILWCLLLVFLVMNCVHIWLQLNCGELTEELEDIHNVMLDTGIDFSQNSEQLDTLLKNDNTTEAFYAMTAKDGMELYKNLDIRKVKELKQELYQYYPEGSFETFINQNYEKLQQRVEVIKKTGEGDYAFYSGYYYQLHSLLYNDLLQSLILQMVVIMVLSVLLLMDYERFQKTTEVVLVSKLGRNLMMKKAQVGLLAGMLYGVLLMLLSFVGFFSQISFEGLWNVPVSSGMLAEPRGVLYYPFITFDKITVGEYLTDACMIGFIMVFLSGILAAALQFVVKNSYVTFLLEAILLLGMLAGTFCKTVTWFDVLIDLNPVATWFMCGAWFMENSIWTSFEGTEWISMFFTFCVTGILLCMAWRRYKKRDILCNVST